MPAYRQKLRDQKRQQDFDKGRRTPSQRRNSSHSNISEKVANSEIVKEEPYQQQQEQQQQQQQQPEQAENLIIEYYNDNDMVMKENPSIDEIQRKILRQQIANEKKMFALHHQQQKQEVAAASAPPILLPQAPMTKTVSLMPMLKLGPASKLLPTLPTSTQSPLKESNSSTAVAALATQTAAAQIKAAAQTKTAAQIKAAAQTKAAAQRKAAESSSFSSTSATTVSHDEQRQNKKDVEAIEKDFYLLKPEIQDAVDLQETDTDEDGQTEINFGPYEFFADNDDDNDDNNDDDNDGDDYNPKWSNIQLPRKIFQFQTDTSYLGLKGRHPNDIETPLYYFNMMLRTRKEFFSKLAFNCNVYGKQLENSNQIPLFEPVNNSEIAIFIGLCLQMSQLKLPTIAEYFCDDESKSHYGFKGFNVKMSEQRFRYILRCINFNYLFVEKSNDYENESSRSLKSLAAYFNKRMQDLYVSEQRIIIKDPIVFWKGQFKRLSEMTEKFRLNAVHLHHVMVRNGLILKILPEIQTIENKLIKKDSRRLVKMRINMVLQMLKDKLNQGHTVYVSKYYASYALARELGIRSTYCTGFLDKKRYGNSKALLLTSMEPKTCHTRYADSVLMSKYYKNGKSQYFLSSDSTGIYQSEMLRKQNDSCPKIITELNFQMNYSNDLQSYMEEYQLNLRKGEMKWDKCIIIYILNLMVFNAFVLYTTNAASSSNSKLITYPEFRQQVINSLLQENFVLPTSTSSLASSTGASSTSQPSSSFSNNSHGVVGCAFPPALTLNEIMKQENDYEFISFDEDEHAPMIKKDVDGKYLMKKCIICFMQISLESKTKYFCGRCPGQPGLCEDPCFKIWHYSLNSKKEKNSSLINLF